MIELRIDKLVWKELCVQHIAEKHQLIPTEIEQVIKSVTMVKEGYDGKYIVVGMTNELLVLSIILDEESHGEFTVVTAFPASRKTRREYRAFLERNE